MAAISAAAPSLVALLQAIDADVGHAFRISSLEPMDCSPRSSTWWRRRRVCAALSSAAAARKRWDARGDAPAVHDRLLSRAGRTHSRGACRTRRSAPTSSSGFPARPIATSDARHYLRESPLTHVHVFPYSDRPGTRRVNAPEKVHGSIVRDRASAECAHWTRADERSISAARQHPARPDDRGRVARRDGQLFKGAHSDWSAEKRVGECRNEQSR